jgi:hypothetical protein
MRRREFIKLFGGAAAAWPVAARAEQRERMRRIGIVMPFAKGDSDGEARIRAFKQELAKLGWTDGGNIQFDEHWPADKPDRGRNVGIEYRWSEGRAELRSSLGGLGAGVRSTHETHRTGYR